MEKNNISTTGAGNFIYNNGTTSEILLPLKLQWEPKEDISTYELSLCLPFLLRFSAVLPYEFNKTAAYARHFVVFDPNKK